MSCKTTHKWNKSLLDYECDYGAWPNTLVPYQQAPPAGEGIDVASLLGRQNMAQARRSLPTWPSDALQPFPDQKNGEEPDSGTVRGGLLPAVNEPGLSVELAEWCFPVCFHADSSLPSVCPSSWDPAPSPSWFCIHTHSVFFKGQLRVCPFFWYIHGHHAPPAHATIAAKARVSAPFPSRGCASLSLVYWPSCLGVLQPLIMAAIKAAPYTLSKPPCFCPTQCWLVLTQSLNVPKSSESAY